MSTATRAELIAAATSNRFRAATRAQKTRILDEFVAITSFHRKHAIRFLRSGRGPTMRALWPERDLYNEAVRTALIVVREASDRICSKRLKPLLVPMVEAMERHGHVQPEDEVRNSWCQ